MTSPDPPAAVPESPTAKFEDPDREKVLQKFEDFDCREVFEKAKAHAAKLTSRNFVVEFGPEHSRIAFDLNPNDIKVLLETKRDADDYPIRWINIWNPNIQEAAVEAIGNHYAFSERLVHLIRMSSQMSAQKRTPNAPQRDGDGHSLTRRFRRHGNRDVELAEPRGGTAAKGGDGEDDSMALYKQVKNTVNYFSTDQTQKAFCVGAHWLHKRAYQAQESKSMMPPKHWQWLTLCNDHTVLSIHDQPLFEPVPEDNRDKLEAQELINMRANTLDVLLQLSKCGFDIYEKKPLSLNSVRRPLSKWNTPGRPNFDRRGTGMTFPITEEPPSLADEGTSNLFYYLFEDYVAAGPLKTAEKKLEQITTKVLESARPKIRGKSIDIIPTLHYLSKDLRELKHLFENYRNLINKITALGKLDAHGSSGHTEETRRVRLTSSALSRFERLGDRLQYLMLNSIEGYLGEISAVSSTFFNLTQQKDSEATARLTRSATLLAKLSVFFLPISFLTSYFSIQIEDLYIYWHGTDYWYSFAVIASVSFVSLFFFSRLLMFFSDTLDEWAAQIMVRFRQMARHMGFKVPVQDDDDDQ